MRIRNVVDWRRMLLAAPVLAGVGVAAWLLIPRGGNGSTPRAALVETPPGANMKIGVKKGQLAQDFVARSPDGTVVRLSDLRGEPTVINFWATWCGSCVAELPDLKAVQQDVGTQRLNIVAVNAGEDSSAAKRFLKVLDASAFHVGMDPTLVVADAYGVFGLPMSLFVDSSGVIRAIYSGQLNKDLMHQYVEAASIGADTPDAPSKIRLVTTVARDHILEVKSLGDGRIEFRSKSLRCDESYCSDAAVASFASSGGVLSIERHPEEDPPRIVVRFDAAVARAAALTQRLADQLNAHKDPLYERPLEIRHG